MKDEDRNELSSSDSRVTLFRFELISMIIIIIINIYTIKRTLPSIRNFKSYKGKSVDNGNGRTD